MSQSVSRLAIFLTAFLVPVILYRAVLVPFYTERVGPLREMSGLSVHHFHYGVIFLTIAVLMFVFLERNAVSVALSGLGLGLILDALIPSLLLKTGREAEIAAYNDGLFGTVLLLAVVVAVTVFLSSYAKK